MARRLPSKRVDDCFELSVFIHISSRVIVCTRRNRLSRFPVDFTIRVVFEHKAENQLIAASVRFERRGSLASAVTRSDNGADQADMATKVWLLGNSIYHISFRGG